MARTGVLAMAVGSILGTVTPVEAQTHLKDDAAQARGYTPGVITQGGRTVWISGQTGLVDEQGRSMAGNAEGQARVAFRAIENVVKRAGGSMKDVVSVTVYLTDPRLLEALLPVRREFFPDGNFPASTTVTVHSLAIVGMMVEVSAVAVVQDQ